MAIFKRRFFDSVLCSGLGSGLGSGFGSGLSAGFVIGSKGLDSPIGTESGYPVGVLLD